MRIITTTNCFNDTYICLGNWSIPIIKLFDWCINNKYSYGDDNNGDGDDDSI